MVLERYTKMSKLLKDLLSDTIPQYILTISANPIDEPLREAERSFAAYYPTSSLE